MSFDIDRYDGYTLQSDVSGVDVEDAPTTLRVQDTLKSIGALASDLVESARLRVEAFISPEVPSR